MHREGGSHRRGRSVQPGLCQFPSATGLTGGLQMGSQPQHRPGRPFNWDDADANAFPLQSIGCLRVVTVQALADLCVLSQAGQGFARICLTKECVTLQDHLLFVVVLHTQSLHSSLQGVQPRPSYCTPLEECTSTRMWSACTPWTQYQSSTPSFFKVSVGLGMCSVPALLWQP